MGDVALPADSHARQQSHAPQVLQLRKQRGPQLAGQCYGAVRRRPAGAGACATHLHRFFPSL